MLNPISKNLFSIFLIQFLISAVFMATANADVLKLDEIIAKHLESIGPAVARDKVLNRMIVGTSQFESKLPNRKTGGKFIIVSEASNLFFVSSFNSENYPFEKIGYFRGKINIPFVVVGTRSPLGVFINDHNRSLSEGLFTGSMSGMWNLANPTLRKGQISAAPTKKIDGRKAYVLNYYEAGSSASFTTRIFIDAETFRHVKTEYRDVISPKEAKFGTLGQESGIETVLTESFGDFKNAGGLNLPHQYKVYYMTASNNGVYEYTWDFMVQQYQFNRRYAEDFYNF